MVDFTAKDSYNISDLLHIVALLREPEGGCPWDKEQTHESIKLNFIEETYEVADAIELNDAHLLCEELGDILLQVALHTQMELEKSSFTFDDVCDGICKKLIYRHPHVFGEAVASTGSEVLKAWDKLKQAEKGRQTAKDNLDSVPKHLPALMKADKLGKRAGGYGYDYKDAQSAMDAVYEELAEVREAMASGDKAAIEQELGDALFSLVNVSRKLKVNAEEALMSANDKFARRVITAEGYAAQQGHTLGELTPCELEELWRKAKQNDIAF